MLDLNPAAWLLIFWLFAVGGATGSFLNVVVYRLPLGMSIVHPPSRCPKCGKHIRWFDNVPILGWLMLRGRCRDCGNPISMRYPLVEAITASMFALLAIVELPYLYMHNNYLLYPYHLLLLCTLLSAGLIEYDGHRPPWQLFIPALVVGLYPMPVLEKLPVWLYAVGIAGLLALLGIAWLHAREQKPIGLVLALICVSLYLGRSAVGVIAAAALALYLMFWLLGHFRPKLRLPPTLSLAMSALTWILVWARLVLS